MTLGFSLCLAFMGIWSLCMWTTVDALAELLLVNAALQVVLFACVACVPYWRTGRVSYVDIAWPFGVALIGVQILLLGDAEFVRRAAVGGVYLFIGLRMGVGALVLGKRTGVIFHREFPRYEYRRMLLERAGTKHPRAHMLAEIMAQGLANASALALPGLLIATNRAAALSIWEVVGACTWGVAYVLESTADAQKMIFMARHRDGVCDVGLWRYSRHPNYFAEWLVWSALAMAAIPSWLALRGLEPWFVWFALGAGVLAAPLAMYVTLVYVTGATPAEYYSVRKREGYGAYQARTNMFFPWFPRSSRRGEARQTGHA